MGFFEDAASFVTNLLGHTVYGVSTPAGLASDHLIPAGQKLDEVADTFWNGNKVPEDQESASSRTKFDEMPSDKESAALPWAGLTEEMLGNPTFSKPETPEWSGLDDQNLGNYTYSVSPYSGVNFNTGQTASGFNQQQQQQQPASDPWAGLDEQNYGTFTLGDLQNAMSGAYANAGLRQGDESYYYNLDDEGNRPGEQSAEGLARQEAIRGKASNANSAMNQGLGDQIARLTEGSEDVVGPVSNSAMNINAVKQSQEYKDINAKLNDYRTTPEEREALLEQRKALVNGAIDTSTGEQLPAYEAPTDMQRAYSVLENAFGVDPNDYEALAQFVNANKDASTLGEGQTLDYSTMEAVEAAATKGPASAAIAESTATQGVNSDPVAITNAAQEAQMNGENDRGAIMPGSRPEIENAIAKAMAESGDDYLNWVPSEIYARFLEAGGGNAQAYPTLLDFQLDSSQEEFSEFIEVCHQLYGMYSELYKDGGFSQDDYDIWWAACKEKNRLGDDSVKDVFCVDYENSRNYVDALYGNRFSQMEASGQYSREQITELMANTVRATILTAMSNGLGRDLGMVDSTFGNGQFTTQSTWTPNVMEDMLRQLYSNPNVNVGDYEEGGTYSAHNMAGGEDEVNWAAILGDPSQRYEWAKNLDVSNASAGDLDNYLAQMMLAYGLAPDDEYRQVK